MERYKPKKDVPPSGGEPTAEAKLNGEGNPKPNGAAGNPITSAPSISPDDLPDDNNEFLDALAKLGTLEYEQRRKSAAKELGDIRTSVLDELVAERRKLDQRF